MKKLLMIIGASVLLTIPSLSTVVAVAEDSGSGNANSGSSSNSGSGSTNSSKPSDSSSSSESTTLTESEKKDLNDRDQKRVTAFSVKLATAEKAKIILKCGGAQGLISSVKGRVKGIETSRTEVYGNVVTHLGDLSTKLQAKGVDTTTLNADINTLKTKVTTFNADLLTYKQAVTDLVAIDCKTDPTGFKAALLDARSSLDKVKKDSEDIRAYITGTIKPLLAQIRAQLGKDENGNKEGNSNGQ